MIKEFQIVRGPSIWDLMLALFDERGINPKGPVRRITFLVYTDKEKELGENIQFIVTSVRRVGEDGDSPQWIIKGYADACPPHIPISSAGEAEVFLYLTEEDQSVGNIRIKI